MKLKISLLVLIFATFSCNSMPVKNSAAASKDTIMQVELSKILENARQIKDIKDLNNRINDLKRLEAMYPSKWLPSYYVAYLELKSSFASEPDKKESLLADAKQKIDLLIDNKESDPSEVYTLLGFYYYAKIAQNPQENGQLYYKDVIESYSKAIKFDANNPRPSFLLTSFQNDMSGFLGKKDEELCAKLSANLVLFKNFKLKEPNNPNWGEKELMAKLQSLCSEAK